ncbi:MAG: hypothetical protein ACRDZ4_22820 [Egibacteraceae bacterium]
MAQPRISGAKNRSIVTIGVTAALLSLPLAAPIVAAAANSPFQSLAFESLQPETSQPRGVRPVTRPVAVVDKATGRLIDPKTGTMIDRAKAVLDPATGEFIDPVTGVLLPSDVTERRPVARSPVSRTAAAPRNPVSVADASPTGSLVVPQAASAGEGLLAPADEMVVHVVDEVLGASSDGGLQSLAQLLRDRNSSDDANRHAPHKGGGSSYYESTPSDATAGAVPASNDDTRTIGPAGGSDAVEVQPDALALDASVDDASGAPHPLTAPAPSDLRSSQSYLWQQDLKTPQVSAPADFDAASSSRQLAAGQLTAASPSGVFDGSPSWLVSTASSLLFAVGGSTVAYSIRRFRRRTV